MSEASLPQPDEAGMQMHGPEGDAPELSPQEAALKNGYRHLVELRNEGADQEKVNAAYDVISDAEKDLIAESGMTGPEMRARSVELAALAESELKEEQSAPEKASRPNLTAVQSEEPSATTDQANPEPKKRSAYTEYLMNGGKSKIEREEAAERRKAEQKEAEQKEAERQELEREARAEAERLSKTMPKSLRRQEAIQRKRAAHEHAAKWTAEREAYRDQKAAEQREAEEQAKQRTPEEILEWQIRMGIKSEKDRPPKPDTTPGDTGESVDDTKQPADVSGDVKTDDNIQARGGRLAGLLGRARNAFSKRNDKKPAKERSLQQRSAAKAEVAEHKADQASVRIRNNPIEAMYARQDVSAKERKQNSAEQNEDENRQGAVAWFKSRGEQMRKRGKNFRTTAFLAPAYALQARDKFTQKLAFDLHESTEYEKDKRRFMMAALAGAGILALMYANRRLDFDLDVFGADGSAIDAIDIDTTHVNPGPEGTGALGRGDEVIAANPGPEGTGALPEIPESSVQPQPGDIEVPTDQGGQSIEAIGEGLPSGNEVPQEFQVLNVPEYEGFENSFQQQYDLTDAQAHEMFTRAAPYLDGADGTYKVGTDIRINNPGPFKIPEQAQEEMMNYLRSIGKL